MESTLARILERFESRYYGKYRAQVKEIGSGDQLGLLRVELPDVYGRGQLSPWAEPCVALAGDKYGALALPQDEDWVWIDFIAGDRSAPVWTGASWSNASELPDEVGPKVRLFRTPAEHRVVIDDDKNEIKVVHKSGAHLTIGDNTITLEAGGAKVVVDGGGVTFNDGAAKVDK
ncbi:MAG: phage baseplate assembly protein V [Deltaproteobacteria bacterium]